VFTREDDQDRGDTSKLEQEAIATETAIADNSRSGSRNAECRIRSGDCVTVSLSLSGCKDKRVHGSYSLIKPLFIPLVCPKQTLRVATKNIRRCL
jgi:hypothetical protein